MRNLLMLIVMLAPVAAWSQRPSVSIIPEPVDVQVLTGSFRVGSGTSVSFNSPEAEFTAGMLVKKLNRATGYSLRAVQGTGGAIKLMLNKTEAPNLGNEGYTLNVTSRAVVISANKPAGLFYGVQTLLQLLPPEIESSTPVKASWTIPAVNITDYPRFGWRGIMLDVSRNFFTKEEVMKYIDEMSKYKFNTFHWHLSDDNGWRIEIKSLPRLTEVGAWRVERGGHFGERLAPQPGEPATVGGFYTHDDIKEVIRYASERFITIVPEIDVPGHSMAAIASYPELCCTKDPNIKVNPGTAFSEWYGNGTFKMLVDNTLNPSDENVYAFLDKVFTEIASLFPSQYIHVGGDECYKGYWLEDKGCQDLMKKLKIRHVEDLQGYFMSRVESILKAKGKKLLGWDEILEGEGISGDAAVMSWRGIKGGIEAAERGHYVVMSPTTFAYIDYQQGEATVEPPIYASLRISKSYSFDPVPEGVDSKYILGGQGNLWTEQIVTLRHAEYMTWPRGWALSEVYWSPAEKKNWDDFIRRTENQFTRNDFSGINYSRAIYDPIISKRIVNGKMIVEMVSEAPGLEIRYTVDDSMPDKYAPLYSKPFEIPEGGPVTLRVMTYRNGKPMGNLITLRPDVLKNR